MYAHDRSMDYRHRRPNNPVQHIDNRLIAPEEKTTMIRYQVYVTTCKWFS